MSKVKEILLAKSTSEVSTSDIVTGFWSSTVLDEKEQAIEAYIAEQTRLARIDEVERFQRFERSIKEDSDLLDIWAAQAVYTHNRLDHLSKKEHTHDWCMDDHDQRYCCSCGAEDTEYNIQVALSE